MRVPFAVVDAQVEKMFSDELKKGESVDDRILEIEDFIRVCGWTVEEFESYRQYGLLD